MGSGSSAQRERIQRGISSGIVTLSSMEISSWDDICKVLAKSENIRSLSVSDNRLHRAIPQEFMQLPLWSTLTLLDLSGNSLRCAGALGYDPDRARHSGRGASSGEGGGGGQVSPIAAPLSSAVRLEVLNLSRNRLVQLPHGLCQRFPTLRKLICRGNRTPLSFPGGLLRCIGDSTALTSVDLSDCGLRSFFLVDESTAPTQDGEGLVTVYPALQELLLEGSNLSGVFRLVSAIPPRAKAARFRFPRLKRVSIASPKRVELLEAVDPTIYVNAPELNSLDFSGASNEESIRTKLAVSAPYQQWQRQHAKVIDKQLNGAGTAQLM